MIYVALLQKLGLLVALSILSGFIRAKSEASSIMAVTSQGLLFGTVAVIGMLNPFHLENGLIFDGRSVVISLCTLFFGPVSGGIATLMAMATRISIGGVGAMTGTLVILTSFGIGWAFHRKQHLFREGPSTRFLLGFGVLVHVAMVILLSTTTPPDLATDFLRTTALPVMVTYPLATLLIGKVLGDEVRIRFQNARLLESESQFRAMFEEHKAVELLIDSETGAIVDANPAACEFYGWSRKTLKSMTIFEINTLPMDQVRETIRKARQQEQNHFEFQHRHADGNIRDVEVYSSPIRFRDHLMLHSIIHDVTDRRTYLDQLRNQSETLEHHVEELNRINSELDQFVYSTSHDLRAPLLAVKGLIDLSQEDVEPGSAAAGYLDMMRTSIDRADATIRGIVEYSRNTHVLIHPERIDLRELLSGLIDDIRKFKPGCPVRFDVRIDGKSDIISDRMRLQTILTNLLANAVTFQRPDEPDPMVVVHIDTTKEASVRLRVRDNGEGIPQNVMPTLFEMFARYSARSAGSGIGLYIVKEMVRKLGGRIEVESTVGAGTEFIVTLPEMTDHGLS